MQQSRFEVTDAFGDISSQTEERILQPTEPHHMRCPQHSTAQHSTAEADLALRRSGVTTAAATRTAHTWSNPQGMRQGILTLTPNTCGNEVLKDGAA